MYTRTTIKPTARDAQQTVCDLVIKPAAGDAVPSKDVAGDYDVVLRLYDRMEITHTREAKLQGFPRSTHTELDVLFLSLYAAIGKERCTALLKRAKKGVIEGKSKKYAKVLPSKRK